MAQDNPYEQVVKSIEANTRTTMDDRERMKLVVDAIWKFLGTPDGPVSWVGFYLPAPDGQSLILGHSRKKPACSPIGLHGVCGKAYLGKQAILVPDTALLGDDYIACDPRDRSEVVIPLIDENGEVLALLDVDSHEVNAYDWTDLAAMARVLTAAGFQAAG